MASKPVVLPETFQGTTSWEDWIEHFERVAVVNEWTSNASKLKWLKVRLVGKAAAALKRFSDDTRGDYAALKGALRKRFEPASKKELYMAEFQVRRKQQDEDWASFSDNLRTLAEKSYPDLATEAQEVLALNRFLSQLDNPQVNFAVRQKQPTNIDQAVQYTLEAESYLQPHKQPSITSTLPVAPLLPEFSVGEVSTTNSIVATQQLIAATPTTSDPMSSIMKRLDEIESQLKSVASSKKWERDGRSIDSRQRPRSNTADQSHVQRTCKVVCFKCGLEGHFARGCAVRQRSESYKQPMNAVSDTSSQDVDAHDAVPVVSHSITMDYHLQGTIEGIPAKFLVDTGATTSVLAKTIWDRLNQGNNDQPVTTVSNQKLVGVEGSPLKVIGSVHLNIVLEQQ